MKEISKVRLGVLKEIKNLRKFLDAMERSVKERDEKAINQSYMFLAHLCYHMDRGCLTPESIALDIELSIAINEKNIQGL